MLGNNDVPHTKVRCAPRHSYRTRRARSLVRGCLWAPRKVTRWSGMTIKRQGKNMTSLRLGLRVGGWQAHTYQGWRIRALYALE